MRCVASKPQAAPAQRSARWVPGDHDRATLLDALIEGGVAGVNSHDRPNVLWKIKRLCEGDTDSQFGLSRVSGRPWEQVLRLVADRSGIDPDPSLRHGLVIVDAEKVLEGFEQVGARLRLAADRGERVLLATGHPTGLPLLYQQTGRLLLEHGATLVRPLDALDWPDALGRRRRIRFDDGVALLTDRRTGLHTHSPEAMERMLAEERPDLVFGDHGMAGAAIEAGVDTVAIADVNDPALVVAHEQGRVAGLVVMDDNVDPDAYWPGFQVIASRFRD
jgi:hypothetical protein